MPLNHPTIKIPGQPLNAVADWNANHVITGGVLDIGANNFIVDTNVLFVNATTNRVGIGETSPGADLHVKQPTTGNADIWVDSVDGESNIMLRTAASDKDMQIFFREDTSTTVFSLGYDQSQGNVNINPGAGIDLALGAGGVSDYLYILDGGNVGIGTASPSKQLEIGGTGNLLLNGSDSRFIIDGTTIIDNARALTNIATFRQTESANDNYFLGNVGIGTITLAVSALLDLTSTTGALLLTRMTTAQRNALTAVNGMIIYNSDTNKIEGYENAAWVDI